MSTRVPPSLKWLIDKRARLHGEIIKTQNSIAKAHQLIDELKKLNETLAAIDKTLELHEIKIDVINIQPIHTKYVRLDLPHGSITNAILTCLRLYTDSNTPIYKTQIVEFLIARHSELDAPETSKAQVSMSVKSALKRLYRNGVIKRHHHPDDTSGGSWSVL